MIYGRSIYQSIGGKMQPLLYFGNNSLLVFNLEFLKISNFDTKIKIYTNFIIHKFLFSFVPEPFDTEYVPEYKNKYLDIKIIDDLGFSKLAQVAFEHYWSVSKPINEYLKIYRRDKEVT